MLRPRLLTLAAFIGTGVLAPATVLACSCDHPTRNELIVGSAVPVNGGFSIWHRAQFAGTGGPATERPEVVVETVPDHEPKSVVVQGADRDLWTVTIPDAEVGETLVVTSTAVDYESVPEPPPQSATFTIAPQPRADGTFELSTTEPRTETLDFVEWGGGCSFERSVVFVDIVPELGAELAKFSETLLTEATVDGERLPIFRPSLCTELAPSSTALGHNRYRVWAECEWDDDRAPVGTREVEVRAWLPGTDLEWTATTTVELQCEQDVGDGEMGGGSGGHDGGVPGLMPDAGSSASSDGGAAASDPDEAGCRSATGTPAAGALVIFVLAALSLRRRK